VTTISVQIITGPGTTRREAFDGPVSSCGRDPANNITLAEPTASRRHGELRYQEGRWVLVNLSPNGTRVNGRSVSRKAQPLTDKDMVSVGGQPVFQVLIDAAPAAEAAAAPPEAKAEAGTSRRTKLWIGIGVYLVLMTLGVIIAKEVFITPDAGAGGAAARLSEQQIRDAVLEPIKVASPDPAQASRYLDDAKEYYNKLDTSEGNLYAAYHAYQLALANLGKQDFEGIDQRQFTYVQDRLIEEVTRLYNRGYNLLQNSDYRGADEAFKRVTQVFPNAASELFQNASEQRSVAARHLRRP
jgi:tetratricopeptide (TPR) repeat protein